jgi:hypothetical protein
MRAAKAWERKGGRRLKLGDIQRALAVDHYRQEKPTVAEICGMVGIIKPTLYAYVRQTPGNEKS